MEAMSNIPARAMPVLPASGVRRRSWLWPAPCRDPPWDAILAQRAGHPANVDYVPGWSSSSSGWPSWRQRNDRRCPTAMQPLTSYGVPEFPWLQ
jgi:hypothetical protein